MVPPNPNSNPNLHKLARFDSQVVPDLEKFMETLNNKLGSIFEMINILEDKENPPPMDRYALSLARIYIKIYLDFSICLPLYDGHSVI